MEDYDFLRKLFQYSSLTKWLPLILSWTFPLQIYSMWSFKWSKADRLGLSLYILNSIKPLKLELLWNSYSIFTYQVTRQNEYRNNENPNLGASKDNSNCRKCCLWQILSSWSNIGLLLYPTKISFIFRNNPATFQAFNWEKMTKFFHSWLKKPNPASQFQRIAII